MRLKKQRIPLLIILVLVGLSVASLAFNTVRIGDWKRGQSDTPMGLTLGLDLKGGAHLVYRAVSSDVTKEQMEGVSKVIERRINSFGVSESVIQLKGNNEIVIQLPGVSNIDDAKKLIGGTAQLEFRECGVAGASATTCPRWDPATAEGSGGVQKHLTGAFLRPNSFVGQDPNTGLPEVRFEFNNEGARMFEQITRKLLGLPLGIFLDGQLISAPTVQAIISQTGTITGLGSAEARLLAIQLNAGALPVPIAEARVQEVSPTLGKDSLDKSYIAAAVGLGLVMLFMVLYYRLPGLFSVFALAVYAVLNLAIFKLFPVTLTLSGIAAFVVSVGMAVDANVLIFERIREELRNGRTLGAAVETGFDRAWAAIRDGNAALIISMAILWWFGEQLGEPRIIGFGVTLIIGTLVSMFTAITVTKTFMRLFVGTGIGARLGLYVPVKRQTPARPALGV